MLNKDRLVMKHHCSVYKRPTGLKRHLSIKDYTYFLPEGLVFVSESLR